MPNTTKKKTVKKAVKAKSEPKKYKKKESEAALPAKDRTYNLILPFVFGTLGLFIGFCFIFTSASGAAGQAVKDALFGVFGISAVILPLLIISLGIFWRRIVGTAKIYRALIAGLLGQYFTAVFFGTVSRLPLDSTVKELYRAGADFRGGGVIGGSCAGLFASGIGEIFTAVLAFTFAFISLALAFGITPAALIRAVNSNIEKAAEDAKEKRTLREHKEKEQAAVQPQEEEPIVKEAPAKADVIYPENRKKQAYDYENEEKPKKEEKSELEKMLEDEEDSVEYYKKTRAQKYFENDIIEPEPEPAPEPVKKPAEEKPKKEEKKEPVLEVKRSSVSPEEDKPAYTFPPVSLLTLDTGTKNEFAARESREGVERLISVLDSFKVKASVENVARGPAVTRYELKPAPGVRISAISRLLDEIALSFSVSNVRFEPSIEGKGAVGIEVPNKNVSIVHIRSLIDTDKFRNNTSKISCALGVDVTGEPVFCDIAKCPICWWQAPRAWVNPFA